MLFRGESFEVTTFRIDGYYSDGRRPSLVDFTSNLEEDLKRRDFTINAMALDLVDGLLIDPHEGRRDLELQVLRAIGNAGVRFEEDALRLLRLYRFSAQLVFSIDPETEAAVESRRPLLARVSRERVRDELVKSMDGVRPDLAFCPLSRHGFLEDFFPLLNLDSPDCSVLAYAVSLPSFLRWSFWLTVVAFQRRAFWEKSLKNLVWSKSECAAILGPTKLWDFLLGPEPIDPKAIIEAWGSLERIGHGLAYLEALEAVGFWHDRVALKQELRRIEHSGEPIFLSDLDISGSQLMDHGVPPGPELGLLLKKLQHHVWHDPEANSRETLLKLAELRR